MDSNPTDLRTARIAIDSLTPARLAEAINLIDCKLKRCKHERPAYTNGSAACRRAFRDSYKSDRNIQALCIMCSAPGTLQCEYSRLKHHEPLCKTFKEAFHADHRPTPEHVRVLVYPQSKTAPEFHWARAVGNNALETDRPALAKYLRKNTDRRVESINGGLGLAKLGHGLHIHFAPCRFEDAEGPLVRKPYLNRSIAALGPPGHLAPMYAHAIVFAFKSNTGLDMGKLEDVAFRDARHSIDWLHQSPFNPVVVDPERLKALRPMVVVPAIKLNNVADPALSTLGVSQDQVFEQTWAALDRLEDFRPGATPNFGLRYWIRLPRRRHVSHQSAEDYTSSFPGWHPATYYEVGPHKAEKQTGDSPSLFDFTMRTGQHPSVTVVHSSGAAIPLPHIRAYLEYMTICCDTLKASVAGKTPTWPALIVEKLGETGIKKHLTGFMPGKREFEAFWHLFRDLNGHAGLENPWEFEARHKHRSVFMDADGKWPALGEHDYNYLTNTGSYWEETLITARRAGHVNAVRAAERERYNGGQPRDFAQPTQEDIWIRDMMSGQPMLTDRARPNAEPEPEGYFSSSAILDLPREEMDELEEAMRRVNPTGGPITIDDPRGGGSFEVSFRRLDPRSSEGQ